MNKVPVLITSCVGSAVTFVISDGTFFAVKKNCTEPLFRSQYQRERFSLWKMTDYWWLRDDPIRLLIVLKTSAKYCNRIYLLAHATITLYQKFQHRGGRLDCHKLPIFEFGLDPSLVGLCWEENLVKLTLRIEARFSITFCLGLDSTVQWYAEIRPPVSTGFVRKGV